MNENNEQQRKHEDFSDKNVDVDVKENPQESVENNPSNSSKDDLWDTIGFHKPIAGFWYSIVLTAIGIVVSAIVAGYLLGFFYPWPESFGYKDVVFSYFNLLWLVFDTGTRAVMSRFIPETNIKNPKKMIKYIQYFIWYQMITGLLQTTIVSIYAIFFASETSMAYTVWIMLVASTTQYPGFLHVFKNVLESLQQYDKTQFLNFLSSTILQRLTELFFVYMGRLWGEANPQFGPILGIAIGASIGLYVDDFIAMAVSALFFDKVLKGYGISSKECFRVYFTWKDIKPVILFSLKVASPEILNGALGFLNLLLWLTYLPQYTTLLILAYIGGSIADIMNWFGTLNIDAPIAEAFLNGKINLAQYYLGQTIRFNFLVIGFFAPIILIVSVIMPVVWVEFNMLNYLGGTMFIIPRLIKLSFERILWPADNVIVGTDRPNFKMAMGIIGSISTTLCYYLLLGVFKLPEKISLQGVAWLMELGWLPVGLITSSISYFYIHKKIFSVQIPWKQILIGICLPSCITYFALYSVARTIFFPLYEAHNIFVAIFAALPVLILGMIFIYFPLSSLMGGWDDINLDEFRKSAAMSGPSKFLVVPLYRLVNFFSKKSKLHNRFAMESDVVLRQAQELFEIKLENRKKFREQELEMKEINLTNQ